MSFVKFTGDAAVGLEGLVTKMHEILGPGDLYVTEDDEKDMDIVDYIESVTHGELQKYRDNNTVYEFYVAKYKGQDIVVVTDFWYEAAGSPSGFAFLVTTAPIE